MKVTHALDAVRCGSVKLRYEKCLQVWGNARYLQPQSFDRRD